MSIPREMSCLQALQPLGVGWGGQLQIFFAGNCLKYRDLHRNVIFLTLHPMGRGGGSIGKKIFLPACIDLQ